MTTLRYENEFNKYLKCGNPIYDYDILKENTIYLCLIDIYYEIQGVVF